MTEIKNYPKEFIERTERMLDALNPAAEKEDLEVTFFLNCLLGMIVSVLENINENNKKLFNIKLNESELTKLIPEKIATIKGSTLLSKFKEQVNNFNFLSQNKNLNIEEFQVDFIERDDILNYELIWLLRKLRNGIAHQNIIPINEDGKWTGVIICNYDGNGIKNFDIEFDIEELKNFSKYIVKLYLQGFN